jgi:transposase InsO family protein
MTTTKAQMLAAARMALVTAWAESGITNAALFVDGIRKGTTAVPLGTAIIRKFSAPTLYRWRQKSAAAKAAGVDPLLVLSPGYKPLRGAGAKALSHETKQRIQELWGNTNRPTLASVLRLIEEESGQRLPSSTAARYVNSLPARLVAEMRYGHKKVNDRYTSYISTDYTRFRSMEMVSSDHHCLDLLCAPSPELGAVRPFRPWITLFHDYRSRKPLGWVLSACPNGYTILEALLETIERYGVPEILKLDNGKDYRQKLFEGQEVAVPDFSEGLDTERLVVIEGVFAALECQVIHSIPYHGQSKPVERFFKDLAEGCSKMFSSYLGSNTVERPENSRLYESRVRQLEKREDLPTFNEVRIRLENWIQHWSATHHHRGQGMNGQTPDQAFAANWSIRRVLPADKRDLVFVRTWVKHCGRNGVSIDGHEYFAPELGRVKGSKVLVKRPLKDVSRAFVYDLDGRFICEAVPDLFVDSGLAEENIARQRKANKEEKAILADYDLRRHREKGPSALERAAMKFRPAPSMPEPPEDQEVRMVAGGVIVPDKKQSGLTILKGGKDTDKTETKFIGLLE